MMSGRFGGYGVLVIIKVAIVSGVIGVIRSVRRMDVFIIMRMRHSFPHAAVGQHQTEQQNHAKHAKHDVTLAERPPGNNLGATDRPYDQETAEFVAFANT